MKILGKYLGCNIEVDGRSSTKFKSIVEKVRKKVSDWKHLRLSPVRRTLLINGILASLCHHILSVFLIPKKIDEENNAIFAAFLWSNNKGSKRIHWRKRETMELPKGGGGLGIRIVNLFYKSLLTKQEVRIHNNHSLLVS